MEQGLTVVSKVEPQVGFNGWAGILVLTHGFWLLDLDLGLEAGIYYSKLRLQYELKIRGILALDLGAVATHPIAGRGHGQ